MVNLRIPLIFLIILFLSSCQVSPKEAATPRPRPTRSPAPTYILPTRSYDLGDGGLISKQPCGPPCFQGITIGMRVVEAVEKLKEKGIFQSCNMNSDWIDCYEFTLFTRENTIGGILFAPRDVMMSSVLDNYGAPDGMRFENPQNGTGAFEPFWNMQLCYSNISAQIALEYQDNSKPYEISPTTSVIQVFYLDVDYECLPFASNEWQGYGKYRSP